MAERLKRVVEKPMSEKVIILFNKLIMKHLFTSLFTFSYFALLAQNTVTVREENNNFSVGSKNSIVVNIPYGSIGVVEKALKSELKDWDGKFNTSKGEYTSLQAKLKVMGDKPFDAYAKIINSGDLIKVAVAIDLGGAFMTSDQHGAQFSEMREVLRKFAIETAQECVDEDFKMESKKLEGFEKEQKDLEKEKENLLNAIDDYRKRISEAEKKIEENMTNQSSKKTDISTQSQKVKEIEKKKNIK